jgi:hypothetical protein
VKLVFGEKVAVLLDKRDKPLMRLFKEGRIREDKKGRIGILEEKKK